MLSVEKQLMLKLDDIVDAGHGDDGKFAETAVDDNRLCVGVGNDSYPAVARKCVEVALNFVRKYEFSILWIERVKIPSRDTVTIPARLVPMWEL